MYSKQFENGFERVIFKSLLIGLGIFLLLNLQSRAAQAGCPLLSGKTIRWIVPYSAGGGFDIYSRLIAPYLESHSGAKVRVENMPGGGGMIATKTIMKSRPDGLTLGLINTPGILAAMVTGLGEIPDPAKDFTIIGRMVAKADVFTVKADSEIKSMDDLFALAKKRPVLFGITDVGSSIFLNATVTADILELNTEYVAGYPGTRQTTMAVMRGEVDASPAPFSSVLDRIDGGELRVVLQITSQPVANHPSLKGVPVLGGPDGLAALRARQLGRDAGETAANADALVAMSQSGRLVVAPAGLDASLAKCLQDSLMTALADPEFVKAAAKGNHPVQPMDAQTALDVVVMAAGKAAKFAPIVKKAIEQVRK
jgi:tripartite-type tricarboxylate transporter receptor subunit TctC